MPETLQLTADTVTFQCRHIRPDGRRCGSPSLRNGNFCYHHDLTRRRGPRQPQVNTARAARLNTFNLPTPADLSERTGLQLAIAQILGKIANNEIDPRRAGLLLYGLQIAASLLPKPERTDTSTPAPVVDEVTEDPELGTLAPQAEWTEGAGQPPSTLQRWILEMEAEQAEAAAANLPPPVSLNASFHPNRAQRRACQRLRSSAQRATSAASTAPVARSSPRRPEQSRGIARGAHPTGTATVV